MEKTLILSWDVGIKHLAYNLSEYEEDNSIKKINFVIKQWGIVNLALEQCSFCEKDGTYLLEEKYYCIEHCKKLRAKHFCYAEKCYNKAKYQINLQNIPDFPDTNKYVCDAHGPQVYGFDNATEILKKKLIEKLDLIPFGEFKYVLIENQPTFKNPKMKAIADTLYAWFLIRKIVDAKTLLCENIRLISPSRKNTLFIEKKPVSKKKKLELIIKTELETELEPKSKKPTYQEVKKLSIAFCENIINPEWNAFFKEFSKKDDLADCLLQGYSFYHSLINEKIVQNKRASKTSKNNSKNNTKNKNIIQ